MRIIMLCLILLAALFVGHSVLGRTKADRNLKTATGLLPGNPMGAYRTMREVLDYNRLVALGKVGEVEHKFLNTLETKIVSELAMIPPGPDAYSQAEQALAVLDQISRQTQVDVRKQRLAILKAAKDSAGPLREKGSLRAWDNMMTMFQNLGGNQTLLSGVFEDFGKWYDEQKAVERRPIGLRDAIKGASEMLGKGLNEIQLRAAGPGEKTIVVAAPPKLANERLIAAERAFDAAQRFLDGPDGFMALFGEKDEIPTELMGIQAKIAFNRAALKLANFQDNMKTIYQTGSDFMAEFLVRSDTSYVPSAGEMVGTWMQTAQSEFQAAQRYFVQAKTLDPLMRQAYAVMSIWMEGELLATVQSANPQEQRVRAMNMARGLTGTAAELVQALPKATRALLIVEVP